MRLRSLAAAPAVLAAIAALAAPVQSALPPGAERSYRALSAAVRPADAFDVVTFMDGRWRIAGNPDYDASIDHIRDRLGASGFSAAPGADVSMHVEEFDNGRRGWDYRAGTVAFDEPDPGPPLLSRARDRVSLAINSFSTPEGGLRAPLVDIGSAADADYADKAIEGAVVLTDAALGRVWREAVKKRGAAGVISTQAADFVGPRDRPLTETQLDVLQWDSIPDDAVARSFGFKASRRAADRMRRRLRAGRVRVRVNIVSTFYDRPDRTLVAEIRGRSRPEERIVLVAHVQEPGANDNASGCGTLLAIAAALRRAIADGVLPPPERTLTFLWLDESRGSDAWLAAHSGAAVQYMFALDMTGEDITKTGGTFLIEKQADPSAVWTRPSDPHTEWSQGPAGTAASTLQGSLLNVLYLAICRRRGRDVRWEVRTNPYEGGSDHTVFARAGVPSLLAWHFTDRYYHSNQDRLDKTSAAEMANVAIATGAAAWFLAGASRRDAGAVAELIARAGVERLALERRQGQDAQDQAVEQQVRTAWLKWYGEALDSVLRLPPAGADAALRARVELAKTRLR